jgi:hypothetical protein
VRTAELVLFRFKPRQGRSEPKEMCQKNKGKGEGGGALRNGSANTGTRIAKYCGNLLLATALASWYKLPRRAGLSVLRSYRTGCVNVGFSSFEGGCYSTVAPCLYQPLLSPVLGLGPWS